MGSFFGLKTKNWFYGFLFILICILIFKTGMVENKVDQRSAASTIQTDVALKTYRKMLKEKLKVINQALSTVQKSTYEKQYKVIGILIEKILKFFSEARLQLTELGVAPGDPFPTEEKMREVYSLIIENTYFLGKLVLHMPDIVHNIIPSHPDWRMHVQYAIGFSNDSNVFNGVDDKILNLMAQEFDIIKRSPDYVNPNSRKYKEVKQRQLENEMKETKKAKIKEKKKKQKGPKLSGPRRYEL